MQSVVAVLALATAACAHTDRGEIARAERAPTRESDAASFLGEAIARAANEGMCGRLSLVTEDHTGSSAAFLDSLSRRLRDDLAARGVAVSGQARAESAGWVWITAAASDAGLSLRAFLDWGPFHRPLDTRSSWTWNEPYGRTLVEIDVRPSGFSRGSVLGITGARWSPGPFLPWAIRDLAAGPLAQASPDGSLELSLSARCADGERGLAVRFRGDAPTQVLLVRGPKAPFTTKPSPLRVPSEVTGELHEIPLRARLDHPTQHGVFVAIDELGRLWYGTDLGLWGPPVPGFKGGLASFADGFVVAAEPTPGQASLVHVRIGSSRQLVTSSVMPLGAYPVDALVNVDLGGDGALEVLIARRAPTGSRLILLQNGAAE